MRRVIVISLAGIALSGCASFSVPGLDFLTPSPQMATLQLESMPPGAEARTSAGPSCRTPCSVSVPAAPLTVTYTLDRYQPQTVSVQPLQQTVVSPSVDDGGTSYVVELDPNPVFAQLAPSAPREAHGQAPAAEARRQAAAANAPPPVAPRSRAPASSSPFPSR